MMKFAPLALALALPLALVPAGAQAQMGGPGVDCRGLAETHFTSRQMEGGRYLYQMTIANRSTGSLRYSYSFAAPGSRGTAEALNGYLTPGDSIEHALGSGTVNLTAESLRTGIRLRCFPL